MGTCALIFWLLPGPLVRPFHSDPLTVSIATRLLLVAGFFQIMDVLIPTTYCFAFILGWGAVGAWLALTFEMSFVSFITTRRFLGRRWYPAHLQ